MTAGGQPAPERAPAEVFCSFCLKSQHEVAKLVGGGGEVHICDDCVRLAGIWMAGDTPDLSGITPPERLPVDRLLRHLAAIEQTRAGKGGQLQWTVDQLRARGVSWAQIGEALGVSRQAAWERFS